MKVRIERFIAKYAIVPEDILYILREDGKTHIHLSDGRIIETYFSIKKLLGILETEDMLSINKGITVSRSHIVSVDCGIYRMDDGKKLKGRVRTPGEHKRNGAFVTAKTAVDSSGLDLLTRENIPARFSMLDELPIPFGVFEIICNDDEPTDLIFRYLNSKMAELAGDSVRNIMGSSFYKVFKNGDKKWMEINVEVATTGIPQSVRRFSPELGRYVSLFYYCPLHGFCAYALI